MGQCCQICKNILSISLFAAETGKVVLTLSEGHHHFALEKHLPENRI